MAKKEIIPTIGDVIKVELNDGEMMEGNFGYDPTGGDAVLNQHGFPFSYKRVVEIL